MEFESEMHRIIDEILIRNLRGISKRFSCSLSWTDEELAAQNQISDLQTQVEQLKSQLGDQQLNSEELVSFGKNLNVWKK